MPTSEDLKNYSIIDDQETIPIFTVEFMRESFKTSVVRMCNKAQQSILSPDECLDDASTLFDYSLVLPPSIVLMMYFIAA